MDKIRDELRQIRTDIIATIHFWFGILVEAIVYSLSKAFAILGVGTFILLVAQKFLDVGLAHLFPLDDEIRLWLWVLLRLTVVYLVALLLWYPVKKYRAMKERHEWELAEERKRFDRKLSQMEAQANIYSWEGVTFEIYDDTPDGRAGVGIKVTNDKPVNVSNLSGTLVELYTKADGTTRPDKRLLWLKLSGKHFTSSYLSKGGTGENEAQLVLVDINRDGAWLCVDQAYQWQRLEQNIHYTLTVKLTCKIQNQPIREKTLEIDVAYNGEKAKVEILKTS